MVFDFGSTGRTKDSFPRVSRTVSAYPGSAPPDQTCARREALARQRFRAARQRGLVDRFQCSLRTGPAAAGVARSSEPAANHRAFIASQAGYYDSQPAKITGMDAGIPLAAFPAVSESVTKEGVGIRSEVPGLKTKDKNPACIARDIRPVFDSPDLPCAEARLNEIVEKYQKPAPKLASWLEGNLIDGLTVFKLPEHFRRRL